MRPGGTVTKRTLKSTFVACEQAPSRPAGPAVPVRAGLGTGNLNLKLARAGEGGGGMRTMPSK
jgi:hypothetical protein